MKSSQSTSEIRTNLESDIKMPSGLDLLASVAAFNDDKLSDTEAKAIFMKKQSRICSSKPSNQRKPRTSQVTCKT